MGLNPTEADLECGFTGHLAACGNAVLVPGDRTTGQLRQIFAPDTSEVLYHDNSAVLRPISEQEREILTGETDTLSGRYVFGGYVRVHFGHFLVECLSPLWALDHTDGPCDGILFFPYHANPDESERNIGILHVRTERWLRALGVSESFRILRVPTRVDHIVVGENGFGFGERFRGSSFFHTFMRRRNATPSKRKTKSADGRRLYLTRRGLGARKGQIIGEEQFETTLVEAGYEAYAPEQFPLEEQLATYRQASHIVGVEGSALHVPPFCCPESCQVAIVSRRSQTAQIDAEFGEQYRGFAGIDPTISCELQEFWHLPGMSQPTAEALAVIDFDKTYRALIEAGFLSKTDRLYAPGPIDLVEHVKRASIGHKKHLHIVGFDPTQPPKR